MRSLFACVHDPGFSRDPEHISLAQISLPSMSGFEAQCARPIPEGDAMKIHEAHDLFQLQLRANGRSINTQQQYARHVRLFESWLEATNRSADINHIDHVAVAEFLCSPTAREKRGGGPRKATSANGLRSSLRVFFSWTQAAGYATRNPAALVQRARCSPVMGRVLSPDEVKRLEHVLATSGGPEAERDRVMFGIMLGCGLRVGSLAGLCAEDVAGEEILVRRAKGDAPVRVFVPRTLRPLLDRYIQEPGPLFTGRSGRPLTTRHVTRRLRHWCERAGIQPVSPHALRRTFGTRLYGACRDPLVVQRGLGHRSLASTLAYVGGVEERLREVVGV
jgi:integrase/recombinase XerC